MSSKYGIARLREPDLSINCTDACGRPIMRVAELWLCEHPDEAEEVWDEWQDTDKEEMDEEDIMYEKQNAYNKAMDAAGDIIHSIDDVYQSEEQLTEDEIRKIIALTRPKDREEAKEMLDFALIRETDEK